MELKSFATAGRAVFTIQSEKTGAHFTFRITKAKEKAPSWRSAAYRNWTSRPQGPTFFVSVRTNRANPQGFSQAWAYLGLLQENGGLRSTSKSRITEREEFRRAANAFGWFMTRVWMGSMPAGVSFHHEGLCGRCARKLTDPESIGRGIGPDCWDMMRGRPTQAEADASLASVL